MPAFDLREAFIESLEVRPLSVPLREPFVIASGRVDVTRAVEVEARVRWRGGVATGLGEAACLPPVTREDQGDVLDELRRHSWTHAASIDGLSVVARAGVETAVCDAIARIAGAPVRTFLSAGGAAAETLETDVTVAIGTPARMGELAREWTALGFRSLKVKVGKDLDADVRALEAIGRAAPGARLRVDANGGHTVAEARALAVACDGLRLRVECWEQPCDPADLDAMAELTAALDAPVVADESVKTMEDLEAIIAGRCARGINLKLAKSGGPLACVALGRRAREAGLAIMVGGMVETRLGMTAAANVACALGGAEYVDLDTAWLLADDPYLGGYVASGPHYRMPGAPGLDVRRR